MESSRRRSHARGGQAAAVGGGSAGRCTVGGRAGTVSGDGKWLPWSVADHVSMKRLQEDAEAAKWREGRSKAFPIRFLQEHAETAENPVSPESEMVLTSKSHQRREGPHPWRTDVLVRLRCLSDAAPPRLSAAARPTQTDEDVRSPPVHRNRAPASGAPTPCRGRACLPQARLAATRPLPLSIRVHLCAFGASVKSVVKNRFASRPPLRGLIPRLLNSRKRSAQRCTVGAGGATVGRCCRWQLTVAGGAGTVGAEGATVGARGAYRSAGRRPTPAAVPGRGG